MASQGTELYQEARALWTDFSHVLVEHPEDYRYINTGLESILVHEFRAHPVEAQWLSRQALNSVFEERRLEAANNA